MKGRRQLIGLAVFVFMVGSSSSSFADINDDCVEANDKSITLRKAGKLLEARAETTKCAIAACGEDMQSSCLKRTDDINAALPSIVFDVRDEGGEDVEGVKVSIDGKPADNATAVAISLDPGEHKVVFEVAGQPPVERSFILREGDHQRRERISIARHHEDASPTPRPEVPEVEVPPEAGAARPASGGTTAPTEAGGSHLRTVGLIVGAAGLVGLAIGAISGLRAVSRNSDANCDASRRCEDPQARRDAQGAATLSTISFVAGGALAASGVTLIVLGRTSKVQSGATRVEASPYAAGGGGLMVRGDWW